VTSIADKENIRDSLVFEGMSNLKFKKNSMELEN